MTGLETVREGEMFTLSTARREGEIVVDHADAEVEWVFLDEPDLEDGMDGEINVRVTKRIFSPSGALEKLIVTPASSVEQQDTELTFDDEGGIAPDGDDPSTQEVHSTTGGSGMQRGESGGRATHPTNGSLDKIVRELIGDREFELEDDEESILSAAKRKARSQGRDPAIDPRITDE